MTILCGVIILLMSEFEQDRESKRERRERIREKNTHTFAPFFGNGCMGEWDEIIINHVVL